MTIEEDINEALKKLSLFKKLPEFIDKAKYLEGRLKKGERLSIRRDEFKLVDPTGHIVDYIYLELRKKGEEPEEILTLTCLGDMIGAYENFFEDYRPPQKSQRA